MKLKNNIFTLVKALILINVCIMSLADASNIALETVSIYNIKDISKKTEVLSIQESTQRIALSCSYEGIVDIISIKNPSEPKLSQRFTVTDSEEITSVAFHPTQNYFAVSVINKYPFTAGSIQIHDASTGKLLKTFESGVQPDSLAFSPNGKYLVIANEGEEYRYRGNKFESPEGSVTHIALNNSLDAAVVTQIKLDDYSNVDGMLHKSHARKFERAVTGTNSGEEIEILIKDNTPANTEPEYVAFSPDSKKAFISLQENNGILIIDTASAKIERVFGLGITEHLADIKDNNDIKFDKKIRALREPDGITITPDGKYLLTADEGDTEPTITKILGNKPAGGGRTLSIFNASTGEFIADTGNQLDKMVHAASLYPDGRSEKKGSEPESVVSFQINEVLYAAVGLERANAIALVTLADPSHPKVIDVEAVDPGAVSGGDFAPEGLAYYWSAGNHYIFSANEKSGTMTVMQLKMTNDQVAVE